jgi:multidrug efflux pump subunit AcrA (membrane-fusion protein)
MTTFSTKSRIFLLSFLLALVSVSLLSCGRTITKEDVESQAEDAKEELQKAREETRKAFEIKHDYLRQEQQKLIDRLQNRINDLNDELARLRSVAEQSGDIAISDVNAAISKVELEKNRVELILKDIQNTSITGWDNVSRDINASIANIDAKIDQMIDDLRKMDVLIQSQSDTTLTNGQMNNVE